MSRTRKVGIGIVAVLLVVIAVLVGSGCYLSNLLRDGGLVPDHDDPELTLQVAAIGEGQVTLRITSDTDKKGDWRREGLYGLEGETGYDQVGAILEVTNEQVVRELIPLSGDLKIGDAVRMDGSVFPGDPREAFELPFDEVFFSSPPLGDFPAWLVDGSSDTWVIFVHGKGADRREAFRVLPTLAELGLPTLIIAYRNDEELPPDPDHGFYHYGQTEWRDLEGAATYAVEHGAERLILVGYSMGGAIVTSFLYQSELAERVDGVILDAPMIDFGATVDLGARLKGYPQLFSTLGKALAGFRFDVDWGELDYLKRTDELDVPILLFHGGEDQTVPVETSEELADARPDIVEYIHVADARHVRSWNLGPAAYEKAVFDFLRRLVQ